MAGMFKALSNPQRLRMFVRLAKSCCVRRVPGEAGDSACCVGDLGVDVRLAASTVSHHLKELRQAGLMQVRRRGQRVECWVSEETLRLLVSFFDECGPRGPRGRAAPVGFPVPEGGAR